MSSASTRELDARRGWAVVALLGLLVGCGVSPVELAPFSDGGSAADGDILVGELPAGAVERLRASPEQGERGPLALIYPDSNALVVPANLAPLPFEWVDMKAGPMPPAPPAMPMGPMPAMPKPKPGPAGMADRALVYELRIHGERGELRLFTAATSVSFPVDRWQALVRDHAERALQVELRVLRASGAIVSAEPIELDVWSAPPLGALYAWSTTAQGLSRAGLESTHDYHLATPSPLATRCVGCHALSSDGRSLLAAVGGGGSLASWSLPGGTPLEYPFADADPNAYVFAGFDPGAARIAVSVAGRLRILDAESGQVLQDSAAPMAMSLEYPSWSPNGRSIAVVLGGEPKGKKDDAMGGTIARIRVALDGSLAAPEPIVSAMPDATLRWPSYSPDGQWIVFEKRKGPGQNARDGSLWMVAADGGEAIELVGATERMPPAGASSPAFIPGGLPGRAFLLFASERAVGSFVPADGQRQLFATALDLTRAAQGADPSFPAFWLPFQQRTSSYLRGQWAPALTSCTQIPEICDGHDDDCDGRIDEDCCTPHSENCGDGSDDDCDGSSDEGCGCAFREVCGNAIDDDCDLSVDEEHCVPAPRM